MPGEFDRPSFLVQHVSAPDQHLNKKFYNTRFTWQIVYFAPVDAVGNPDVIDQFSVANQLKTALMENMVLVSPDDGTVFHVIDCDGGPRDAEVYITVRLDADSSRPEPEYDDMQEVNIEVKEAGR